MRISDWSSDVCSSDLVDADVAQPAQFMATGGQFHEAVPVGQLHAVHRVGGVGVFGDDVVQPGAAQGQAGGEEIGRASGRERVCQYVEISVVAVSLKKKIKNKQ